MKAHYLPAIAALFLSGNVDATGLKPIGDVVLQNCAQIKVTQNQPVVFSFDANGRTSIQIAVYQAVDPTNGGLIAHDEHTPPPPPASPNEHIGPVAIPYLQKPHGPMILFFAVFDLDKPNNTNPPPRSVYIDHGGVAHMEWTVDGTSIAIVAFDPARRPLRSSQMAKR